LPSDHELLVLHAGVLVFGDSPARQDGELAGDVVRRTVLGADQDLDKRLIPTLDWA
jgi:hypothetical protein